MIGAAGYLKAKGPAALSTETGAQLAGKSIGTIMDSVRQRAADDAKKNEQLLGVFLAASLTIGVAALGPWGLGVAAGAALGKEAAKALLASNGGKAVVSGLVEAGKNLAKEGAKLYAELPNPTSESRAQLTAVIQQIFVVSIASTLPVNLQNTLKTHDDIKPFLVNGEIKLPEIGKSVLYGGKVQPTTAQMVAKFLDAISNLVPPETGQLSDFALAFEVALPA
jgi:hypothetical protein